MGLGRSRIWTCLLLNAVFELTKDGMPKNGVYSGCHMNRTFRNWFRYELWFPNHLFISHFDLD